MTIPGASHREQRGERVLFVWGDAPFWMVVDRTAARFIDGLIDGLPLAAALWRAAPNAGSEERREAARIVAQLKHAGVAGGRRRRPPAIAIESIAVNVTQRCPLRCTFCYRDTDTQPGVELDAEAIIAALESIRRRIARGAVFALLGGEPLLDKAKTLALVAWARRRGLSSIVSTNGLYVDAEFARAAADLALDCQVSIDGPSAASHDAIRGKGTFDKALAGVATLVAEGAHTILSMVVHAGNRHEVPAYLRMARDLGVAEARFIPVRQVGAGTGFEPPEMVGLIRDVGALLRREPELASLLRRDAVSVMASTCRTCSPRQGCGVGSQALLIDADGTLYGCPNLLTPELAAGNITETPLPRLWQSAPALVRIREETSLEARRACAKCFARHWCLGGCRGEVYAATGRLDGPSPTCGDNRAAVVEMFWALHEFPVLRGGGPRTC